METHSAASPKVFISYSHDSAEHVDHVLSLADCLRAEGIDCHIDQYETSPPEGWPRWMINHIETSNFILLVCTEKYNLRFMGKNRDRTGLGAKWEGAIITQEIYESESNNSKFIPVLFSSEDMVHIPITLRSATYYDLSLDGGYENLYRRLTKQPGIRKPDLGELRPMPPLVRKQNFSIALSTNIPNRITNPNSIGHTHDQQPELYSEQNSHKLEEGKSRVRGSWIFGSLLMIFFIFVFSFGPDSLPEYKTRMLALMSALIAGLFGFFLTGDLGVELKALQSSFGTIGVKAAGGIALFVLTIIWWASPLAPVKTTPNPIHSYKIRLSALNLQKRPLEEAVIWSSPKGELSKVPGGWELIIPDASLSSERKATISIRTVSPPLFRQVDLELTDKPDIPVSIQLERDTSSDVHGFVLDEYEQPISGAIVKVQGYTGEPAKTGDNGGFKFPTNWGRDEQVYLIIEKDGYMSISEYPHLAGEEPAYVILRRRHL